MELHAKFMQDHDPFTLDFGGLATYYGGARAREIELGAHGIAPRHARANVPCSILGGAGLEGLIGAPQPNLREAMLREHTKAADSQLAFEAANYGTQTTPEIEFHFVLCPERGLALLSLPSWPAETRLDPALRRSARSMSSLQPELSKANARLKKLECAPVCEDELLAARLYTGPLFQKYNSVLRGKKSKSSRMFAKWYASCRGNHYTTTLHVVNSVIAKLSQLTVAAMVWRGVSGGVLPREFWKPNEYNVRGGVEWAFLSCTTDYQVAFGYASSNGGPGMVFEMQMGMVDRGADLSWLSQYPHEKEILFSPLSTLEVLSTRVEGATLIISCRLGVNLTDGVTDQVISRRLKLLREMAHGMQGEVSAAAAHYAPADGGEAAAAAAASANGGTAGGNSFARRSVERFNKLLREGPLSADASAYNDDDTFFEAIKQILALKRETCETVHMLPPGAVSVTLAGWSLKSAHRVDMLCAWLIAGPAAKLVDLRASELPLEGSARLGAALRANHTVEKVIVQREAALPVQEASGHTPVAALNLTRRKLGAVAGCVLAELIAFNPALESLALDYNMLGQRDDAACLAIAGALRATPTRLRTLSLRGNYIGLEGFVALVHAAAHNAVLTYLDLRDNEIGNDAAQALVERLGRQSTACGATSGSAATPMATPQTKARGGLTTLRLKGNPIEATVAAGLKVELSSTFAAIAVDV